MTKEKVFKCPQCGSEKYAKQNTVIKICGACQVEMEEVKDLKGVKDVRDY